MAEGSLERGLGLGVLDATVKLDWPWIACMTFLQIPLQLRPYPADRDDGNATRREVWREMRWRVDDDDDEVQVGR